MGSQQKKKKRTKDTRSMDSEIKRSQDLDQNRLAIHSNFESGYSPLGVGTISFVDVSTSMGSTQTGAPAPPPQVTGVTASPKAGSDTQIVINWSAAATALNYNVYVSTTNGFAHGPSNLVTNIAALTYTAIGLIPGTTYYVKVAAVNAQGEGTVSAQASTTTTGTPPPPPTLTFRFKMPFEENLLMVPNVLVNAGGANIGWATGNPKFGHANVYLNSGGDQNSTIDLADTSSPEVNLPINWAGGATISLWIWPYTVANLTDERVILAAAGVNENYQIYMRDGRIGVYVKRVTGGAVTARKVHQTVLAVNTWYHIVFTWDNAGVGDNKIKIYVDKIPDSGLNTPINNWQLANSGEWLAEIGFIFGQQDTTWFSGLIDELQKWDGTANQTQIDNLFAFNHPSGTSKPAQVTGLTVTPQAGSDTQLNLAWTASGASGLINYEVYRSTLNGFTLGGTKIASPTTNSYSDTGRIQGTTYYYRVSAVNHVAEGTTSAQVSGTTTGTPPTLPQILFHWDNSLTDNSGFTPLPTPTVTGTWGYTTPGKFGAAAVDPDPNLMYSQVDRYSMVGQGNDYTISIWIYPTDISSTGMRRCIAQKIDTITGSPGAYIVSSGWDFSISSGGTVRFSVRYIYPDLDEMQASVGGFVVNQWQMVTATIDLLNRELKIYRNATIAGADSSSATQFPSPNNNTTDEKLYFGHMLNESTDTLFVGSLDEFQFYTKILTPAQILNLYNTNAP